MVNMIFSRTLSRRSKTGVPVYLNVYDLTPMNGYIYWFGLGIYHSGVEGSIVYFIKLLVGFWEGFYVFLHTQKREKQKLNENMSTMDSSKPFLSYTVEIKDKYKNPLEKRIIFLVIELPSGYPVHGMEYSFGAHNYPTSGVFEVEPRTCPGYTFRKSICIGRADLNPRELREFMEKLAGDYNGSTYNLIGKNCNDLCNDVCVRLTGNPIPRWVNRLARIGLLCNCVLPVGLHVAAVQHNPDCQSKGDEKAELGSCSRFSSSFSTPKLRQKSLSVPYVLIGSTLKGGVLPWELKANCR